MFGSKLLRDPPNSSINLLPLLSVLLTNPDLIALSQPGKGSASDAHPPTQSQIFVATQASRTLD